MAKLNGVVLTSEAIEYNGAKYERYTGTPHVDDIVRVDDLEGTSEDYATEGAYYSVVRVDSYNDPQITDNEGDELNVDAVDGDGSGDVRVRLDGGLKLIYLREYVVLEPIADRSEEIIEQDGVKYRKVDRKPQVGDFVYATESINNMTRGKLYEIHHIDLAGDGAFKSDVNGTNYYPTIKEGRILVERIPNATADLEREVSELQTKLAETQAQLVIAQDPRSAFGKGDKVRLISGGGIRPLQGYCDSEIYEVNNPYTMGWSNKRVEIIGGTLPNGYALPTQIVKLTAEEVARVEEAAKWTAIGREVGEWKEGDIVKTLKAVGGHPVGTIGKLVYDTDYRKLRVESKGRVFSHDLRELIAPVESVVNLTVGGVN
ncbi:hypothetical protein NQ117_05480 [Paenibacillus sp. SC116]|uniref:hypothetical protein n=1 Tax=Paenibacillus sp. SC116 TaxID=2968986 RepID=UPI00215A879D|nr:hypothetical protein [Paenibacillus sp. SC116]MCR8843124.1 hypothetical protein [Paenibacillus sp. SC116]